MKDAIMNRAGRILKAYRLHRAWFAVFLCLALIVGIATTHKLTQSGVAMTEQVKELDCHVKIHKHTDACKDAEGNLVCGYADYIIHKHSEGCYDAEGNLVCSLPEVKLHEHTAACYDAEGNLICTELTALHTHNDACKDAEGHLICGQIELLEHTHGDGCYKIIEVEVTEAETEPACESAEAESEQIEGETSAAEPVAVTDENGETVTDEAGEPVTEAPAESAAEPVFVTDEAGETVTDEAGEPVTEASAENPAIVFMETLPEMPEMTVDVMPAQHFEAEVEGVKVVVEAEEGTFPAGTTMVVKPVAAETVEGAVAQAVTEKVTAIQAVDITFVDEAGNEIEPAKQISVSITSADIDSADQQTLIKINEDGSAEIVESKASDIVTP